MSTTARMLALLATLALAGGCHAAGAPAPGYRFEGVAPKGHQVSVCNGARCHAAAAPENLQLQLDEGDAVSYVDLDGDGRPELVMSGPAGVNRCITIYKPSATDGSIREYTPGPAAICNYRLRDGYLYSQTREGATLVEERYMARDGRLVLQLRDSCVGCGRVARERFSDGTPVQRLLVSDAPRMEDRTPVQARIVVDRASLFNSADADDRSRMYLVKGDTVEVLEHAGNGDSALYRVRYTRQGRPAIEKWLACSSLGSCR
ncbi:hypothetical protein [Stenotrophomonas sp. 24(2023)]|uniref:hypothetical protein n=1 Tax=Stenotrophomonas sp. 24(2023) TaxID=3068324 RepID=UPI0027E1B9FB|nr:hypothetical protein [Stenotrophomonas sp. 24(2023)]WMJ68707.1 hypothetical protein Q9R17_16175 [Stenotrophomonas sp. 24(2023)]